MAQETSAPAETRFESAFRRLGLAAVTAAVLVGCASLGSTSTRWIALAAVVHLAPAVMLVTPVLRAAGAWLAVFLVGQALLSLAVYPSEVFTLPPNLARTLVIAEGAVPGISGEQRITTDQQGFRVTRPIAYDRKPPRTLRIFAIGGSTTEQALLDDRRTWTHLLQERLQKEWPERIVEVINAGASGTRAVHHLAMLKTIAGYRPDVVLFLLGINDWNKQIKEHYGSNEYGRLHAVLWRIQFENTILGHAIRRAADEFLRRRPGAASAEAGTMLGQTSSVARGDTKSLRINDVDPDYAAVLEEIAAECARLGTQCVLLTQPHAYTPSAAPELLRRFWMTPPFERYTLDMASLVQIAATYNDYLLQFASGQGLMACDVAAAMSAEPDSFYDDCHLNERGARLFAANLAECFIEGESQVLRPYPPRE